jgi:hypothetical protein
MDADRTALRWIVELLRRLEVPYQIVGGLAARAHGATRPLADLDFYVPASRLQEIASAAGPHVVRQPSHHRDDSWDLVFMQIVYEGRKVELAAAEGARFFDRATGQWRDAQIDFNRSIETEIFGVLVRVMPFTQLVAYKRALGRDIDGEDVTELLSAHSQDAG